MARLFELMHENVEVDFDTLKDVVHQSNVEDGTVEKKIGLARKLIERYNVPVELVVSDRCLLRRDKAK